MQCIDLKAEFGNRYKIEYDECQPASNQKDPWLAQIACEFGHIFPHGDEVLAASLDAGHPILAKRLRRLPCVTVHQDGSFDELTVLFNAVDFEDVANVMKPRRKRHLSEEHKAKLMAASTPHRFTPISPALSTVSAPEKARSA